MYNNKIMERLPDRKRPIRRWVGRVGAAIGLIAAGVVGGTGLEAKTGVVNQTAGKLIQTAVDWDNRGLKASSAGIPAQKMGEAMKERDQREQAQIAQVAKDQAESEAIRQKLGTKKNLP